MEDIFIFTFVIIFVVSIASTISRFIKNEETPIIATNAKVYKKKLNLHKNWGNNNTLITTTNKYSIIFKLDTGSKVELNVNRKIYKNLQGGDWGLLTFQGTRFIKYDSTTGIIKN